MVARLECTQPNEGNRCVGAAGGAHTYVKQVRIQLTDVVSPTISIGGSMFSGAELRGPQTISVSAADQGAGLQSVQVVVNGQGGDRRRSLRVLQSAAGQHDLAAAALPAELRQDLHARHGEGTVSRGRQLDLGLRL